MAAGSSCCGFARGGECLFISDIRSQSTFDAKVLSIGRVTCVSRRL